MLVFVILNYTIFLYNLQFTISNDRILYRHLKLHYIIGPTNIKYKCTECKVLSLEMPSRKNLVPVNILNLSMMRV